MDKLQFRIKKVSSSAQVVALTSEKLVGVIIETSSSIEEVADSLRDLINRFKV